MPRPGCQKAAGLLSRGRFGGSFLCYAPGVTEPKSQAHKFREAARALHCDDHDERFEERVQKLVKHEPVERPE